MVLKSLAVELIIELRKAQLKKRKQRIPKQSVLRRWAEAHHDEYFICACRKEGNCPAFKLRIES